MNMVRYIIIIHEHGALYYGGRYEVWQYIKCMGNILSKFLKLKLFITHLHGYTHEPLLSKFNNQYQTTH